MSKKRKQAEKGAAQHQPIKAFRPQQIPEPMKDGDAEVTIRVSEHADGRPPDIGKWIIAKRRKGMPPNEVHPLIATEVARVYADLAGRRSEPTKPLRIGNQTLNGRLYHPPEPPADEGELTRSAFAVLKALREASQPLTGEELIEEAGYGRTAVRAALKVLTARFGVLHGPQGYYLPKVT
ncbi:MAG: hypothetical protein IPH13_12185 [Planctomycetes bacterium]|nr:hypothetical protein [Planctomycetota bacterium]